LVSAGPIVIDAAQRRTFHRLIGDRLARADLPVLDRVARSALAHPGAEPRAARRPAAASSCSLFRRDAADGGVESFSQDMRLMIAFGWLDRDQLRCLGWPEGGLKRYELTLPREELRVALRRLARLARAGTKSEITERPNRTVEERRARCAGAARLCEELLAELNRK
jgi:hypothetical protein